MPPRPSRRSSNYVVGEALRELLAGAIDYAGLFPPARLPMDVAVAKYAEHLRSPQAWLVSRFICPAKRLEEFAGDASRVREDVDEAWRVSVLATGGADAETFLAAWVADLGIASRFAGRHGVVGSVDAFEALLPATAVESCEVQRVASDALGALIQNRVSSPEWCAVAPEITLCFEIPFVGDWRHTVDGAITAISRLRGRHATIGIGAKVRTGGVDASAFPGPERLSYFIDRCAAAGLPFKATAGLHHPIRHFNVGVHARMHGFLNVFTAAVLRHARGPEFGASAIRTLLEDEGRDAFHFDAQTLRWREYELTAVELAVARREFALGFGSCSVDEPVADLTELRLL